MAKLVCLNEEARCDVLFMQHGSGFREGQWRCMVCTAHAGIYDQGESAYLILAAGCDFGVVLRAGV